MPIAAVAPHPPVEVGGAPVDVRRPRMQHSWSDMVFVHWEVPASRLRSHLPDGLVVDTFEGRAHVGLLPFMLTVLTGGGVLGTRFPEVNVRTYVRGPDGVPGIWFLSLDAPRVDAVAAAHLTHSLPYVVARVAAGRRGGQVRYRLRRSGWFGGQGLDLGVDIGAPIAPRDVTARDHHLTARYALYSMRRGRLHRAWVEHPAWPLRRASLRHLDQDLLVGHGLYPQGPPALLYSHGVQARIGPLRPVA